MHSPDCHVESNPVQHLGLHHSCLEIGPDPMRFSVNTTYILIGGAELEASNHKMDWEKTCEILHRTSCFQNARIQFRSFMKMKRTQPHYHSTRLPYYHNHITLPTGMWHNSLPWPSWPGVGQGTIFGNDLEDFLPDLKITPNMSRHIGLSWFIHGIIYPCLPFLSMLIHVYPALQDVSVSTDFVPVAFSEIEIRVSRV
jgi:hypothetical protein